ncbi:MAG: ATP-dependent DNA helicase RecG, partial [Spirochaetia bacterium]|nr:ATP-dependent DNA helicase RecG [Spirochaetia bacterium]
RNIIPESLIEKNSLLSRPDDVKNIHFPQSRELLEKAVKTIKYEEFFLFQKSILELKKEKESRLRKKRDLKRSLQREIIKTLSFKLTEDQITAIDEIHSDGISEIPMSRILQGDVGCGKTIVGFLAALPYIESGYQAAFMAPTELLAKQHLESASRLFSGSKIKIAFLSGKLPEKKKKLVREALEKGEIDLIIGTHSLLSDPVKFKNLGFAIVDEQHKFGVAQRSALTGKGVESDFLMMTATPIPRTLQMTFFGDISISTIRSMPAGRGLIKTHTVLQENIQKVYDWVRREIENGFQAYFVYPLVEESEHLNLKNAESMYAHLEKDIFPEYKCALLHSRVPEEEKENVMRGFFNGEIKILAATSVVEVGIDVPKATCMVIEHAERFGLTALHQLRGRIGRSSYPSYTFLVFNSEMTEDAKARLRIIKDTTDGFKIAEEDLRLRGPGDITGLRQSGFAEFRLADIVEDQVILEIARKEAIEFYA